MADEPGLLYSTSLNQDGAVTNISFSGDSSKEEDVCLLQKVLDFTATLLRRHCPKPSPRSGISFTVITPNCLMRSSPTMPNISITIPLGAQQHVKVDAEDVFGKDLADTLTSTSIDPTIATGVLGTQAADGSYDLVVKSVGLGKTDVSVSDGTNTSIVSVEVTADTVASIVLTAGAIEAAT